MHLDGAHTHEGGGGAGAAPFLVVGLFFVAAAIVSVAGPIVQAAVSLVEMLVIAALILVGLAVTAGVVVFVIRAHRKQGRAIQAMQAEPVRGIRAEILSLPAPPRPAMTAVDRAAITSAGAEAAAPTHTHVYLSGLSPEAAEALGRALTGRADT